MKHIAYNVSKDMKIPYICCTYFMNYETIKQTVSDLCSNTTGPETLDYVVGLFNKVVSEVSSVLNCCGVITKCMCVNSTNVQAIDLGCGKYNSVHACRRMLPQGVTDLENLVTPASKVKPQKETFLIPLIDITRSLDEI